MKKKKTRWKKKLKSGQPWVNLWHNLFFEFRIWGSLLKKYAQKLFFLFVAISEVGKRN